ncbi:Flagellar basal-body rod protein FlgG [Rickettsiales bacterium Ac37b]|nr:Flagellar basal-body rod protein FlgG [Rickettsiales bacterium Ac37b]
MMLVLNIAANGMEARSKETAIIANNVANISTDGYKSEQSNFSDLLYIKEQRPGVQFNEEGNIIPTGIQIGLGTKLTGTYRLLTQGAPKQTNSQFDLSINGNGYFRVEMPDGTFSYTRNGSFKLNADAQLVTNQGLTVSPGIIIPQNHLGVNINESGQVFVTLAGNEAPQLVGQLDIANFPNPGGLEAQGDNLFIVTESSGDEILGTAGLDGMGTFRQGWLESSNVNPITELVKLVTAQRAFEFSSKCFKAGDEMTQTMTTLKT